MTNLLAQPFVKAIDVNGDPISGAKLATFFAGTTTPIAVYTDSALTIPHTNPVIANSRGEFDQIFLSNAEHRLILSDASDAQIAIYENVTRIETLPLATGTTREVQAAIASQTLFTLTNPYILGIGGISVYIQGVLQHSPQNYTETSTTSITFTAGLNAGEEVTFVVPISTTLLINIGTTKQSVNDDSFFTITPPKDSGMIGVFTELTDNAFGKLFFEVVTPFGTEAYSGSLFDVSTGPLTGTTGLDGRLTVSPANDGDIYIENRLGATVNVVWSFLVST